MIRLSSHNKKNYNTISDDTEDLLQDEGIQSCTRMIYLSHTLSSWGDRMWSFAVGLYLVILFPESLKLTAIYGFVQCLSIIVLGAFIGKWIDETSRIKAARVSLLIQNVSVIMGAISLALTLYFSQEIKSLWNGYLETLIFSTIILLAVIAELGSVANKIALEKDWIVVLSRGDERKLTELNAVMRTIDLTTLILVPIFVGQIITYVSEISGAGVIAGWNMASVVIEYLLLSKIYQRVPELGEKKEMDKQSGDFGEIEATHENVGCATHTHSNLFTQGSSSSSSRGGLEKRGDGLRLKKKMMEAVKGWQCYFAHPVRDAGLGLAMLYMTVLGFDSITTGFAYTQGVDESLLGIITAVGAIFGILGSISFPWLRRTFGKNATGNIGFGSETLCLLLCIVSVFAQGSPFKPEAILDPFNINSNSTTSNIQPTQISNMSLKQLWNEHTTVFYLMGGIILARYGLWVADLSVMQIFQENVQEDQRGVLNGIQGSLNQLMNLIKFFLVIIFPAVETFGYLIFLSWIFVTLGWIFYAVYVIRSKRIDISIDKTLEGVAKDNI